MMVNKVLIFLFLCILSSPLYSQNYQVEKDSLLTLKGSLTTEKDYLNEYTDSLAHFIDAQYQELTNCESELTSLKKKLYLKKYGKEDGQRIAAGRVWKGMTMDMLKDIWGKPDSVATNKYSYGVYTQWYYGDITYFFKNSVLIDWEQGPAKKD